MFSLGRNKRKYCVVKTKKKVKDVSHVGFQEGLDSAASLRNDGGFWSRATSFKDKLVGEKSLVLSHKLSALETSWKTMLNLMKRLKPLGKDW